MNRILRVVGGPLKGAEIALVAGTKIKVGSGDGCDVLVSDPSLGDVAFELEVAEDEVTIITPDGTTKTLLDYEAHTFGASSFAVGAADGTWPAVVWPERGEEGRGKSEEGRGKSEEGGARSEGGGAKGGEMPPKADPLNKKAEGEAKKADGKKRHGWLLLVLLTVAIILVLLVLFYQRCPWERFVKHSETVSVVRQATLADVAEKYGAAVVETDGQVVLRGNFKTRAERLEATAAAFQAQPGVSLDLMDDESLDESANALVAMVVGDAVRVEAATNRIVALKGDIGTVAKLHEVLDAMRRDIPGLAHVDCARIVCGLDADESVPVLSAGEEDVRTASAEPSFAVASQAATGSAAVVRQQYPLVPRKTSRAAAPPVRLPVCGILTVPYPCIIQRNGNRVFEGGEFGGYVVEKISADAVTLRDGKRTFEWRP